MRRRRSPEVITGQVRGSDAALVNASVDGVSSVSVGSVYRVTLPPGFRLVNAVASCYAGGNFLAQVENQTDRAFDVRMIIANTGAAGAANFNFVAVGAQQ